MVGNATDLIADGSDLETIWIGAVLSLLSDSLRQGFFDRPSSPRLDHAVFFAAFIAAERPKWRDVVNAAGVHIDVN